MDILIQMILDELDSLRMYLPIYDVSVLPSGSPTSHCVAHLLGHEVWNLYRQGSELLLRCLDFTILLAKLVQNGIKNGRN